MGALGWLPMSRFKWEQGLSGIYAQIQRRM
jgi:hypothetical protein